MDASKTPKRSLFLSTPSARRATSAGCPWPFLRGHFYPRPPRGGRPGTTEIAAIAGGVFLSTPSARRATCWMFSGRSSRLISIHALREEGDPVWERLHHPPQAISIHALREEGDGVFSPNLRGRGDFYPRPPRGGRLGQIVESIAHAIFLSTPSARRATVCLLGLRDGEIISIHALREEGDISCALR